MIRAWPVLLAAASVLGCVAPPSGDSESQEFAATPSPPALAASAGPEVMADEPAAQREQLNCGLEIERLRQLPAQPGAPDRS